MKKNIVINGFGRIGRTFLRVLFKNNHVFDKLTVTAINIGPADPSNIAHLFIYDTIMHPFAGQVSYQNGILTINNIPIKILTEADPTKLPHTSLKTDWVVEASGRFTTKDNAMLHLKAGAKKVLITAPSSDADITIIPGVNDNQYVDQKHNIISLGSCTTNAFAPLVKVIKETFGLTNGLMTTTHAYTNDQVLLDVEHKDPRRARAAAMNIIPTKTGADKVIIQLFPELEGKMKALAIRVPVPLGSLIDFSFSTEKPTTQDTINTVFQKAAQSSLKNILEYSQAPLVSSDVIGNHHSCVFDSLLTQSLGNMHKVFAWYDNEFGYSNRLMDFLLKN